jgi:hypothetical protein
MSQFEKTPTAQLDYAIDWREDVRPDGPWLRDDEQITAAEVTIAGPAGVQLHGPAVPDDGRVVFWMKGGTNGMSSRVTCTITTNQGRTETRSYDVDVRTR